jgi:poly(hydroxyalkanoate) depolymerase family esterase
MNQLTRAAVRAGTQALARTLQQALPKAAKQAAARVRKRAQSTPRKRASASRRRPSRDSSRWSTGLAVAFGAARHFHLYAPPGARRGTRMPVLVLLHGCRQDADTIVAVTRIQRAAARAGCLVLCPEQDRLANPQGCWSWYETRNGRAQAEAAVIEAAIERTCRSASGDRHRVALAGLSAGASMAALVALRHPERYAAVAMHSGVAPGLAADAASALGAMGGRRRRSAPLAPLRREAPWPRLLVIQGSVDPVVASSNGRDAAHRWAAHVGAKAGKPRRVKRGKRLPMVVTDHRAHGALVVRHCEVQGLGHAWSGGAPDHPYSDPRGPDAAGMIVAFAKAAWTARVS